MIAVWGAGGHARAVVGLLQDCKLDVAGVYDDGWKQGATESICGVPLTGDASRLPTEAKVVLAVGDNRKRAAAAARWKKQLWLDAIVHPDANVQAHATLGPGTLVFAGALVNAEAKVGKHCILNSHSVVEHESSVGDFCHVSVNATLCGRVRIGDFCFIGAASVVIDGMTIANWTTIGAGCVVQRDLLESGTYIGVPAKRIQHQEPKP